MSTWNTVLATFWCSPKPEEPEWGISGWNVRNAFGKECVLPDHKEDEYGLWTRNEADDEEYRKALKEYSEMYKDQAEHPENYLPMGSEGSCRLNYAKVDGNTWLVTVFGSLRDRDENDWDDVEKWFYRCIRKCDVRCASCFVSSGPGLSVTYTYDGCEELAEEPDNKEDSNGQGT